MPMPMLPKPRQICQSSSPRNISAWPSPKIFSKGPGEVANSLSYYREKLDGKGVETVIVRGLNVSVDEVGAKLRELELANVESIDAAVGLDLSPGQRVDQELAMRLAPALGAAAAGVR